MTGEPEGELVPARILNEHMYCPRLAYLMWVDGANADNAATLEGTAIHRRVDQRPARQPPDTDGPRVARSVTLGDTDLGAIARIDLMEADGLEAVPVEYKRGSPVSDDVPLHPPELIQLLTQVVLLRRNGYKVPRAAVWFSGSRVRKDIPIPDDAEQRVVDTIAEVRRNAAAKVAPPPLEDSPKCPHCVLVGLCLPDELAISRPNQQFGTRRLIATESPAKPLYLTEPRASIGKKGGRLSLRSEGKEVNSVRLIDVSHVAVFGNSGVTSAAVRACSEMGIPVLWLTSGGWLVAVATPARLANTRRRIAQHRAHAIGTLDIARAFVVGKIQNSRTLLRRLASEPEPSTQALADMAKSATLATDVPSLLGTEGAAARIYFGAFSSMLRANLGTFDFTARNRRPPRDPVNALLSLAYAMLAKDAAIALLSAGLDPYVGLYHRPGFARPALALDLMEEFRPIVADSVVIRAINNGEIKPADFITSSTACSLTPNGRRKFLASYERRMSQELRHPTFGYRATYRRCLEIQSRLLAAVLIDELPEYRPLTTR